GPSSSSCSMGCPTHAAPTRSGPSTRSRLGSFSRSAGRNSEQPGRCHNGDMPWPYDYDLSGNSTSDFDDLVENLAVPHRAKGALGRLMAAGSRATPALRKGLRH